jgi:hypothetical protein
MKYNISQLKPEIKKVSHFYQGLLLEEDKEQENNERDILYNATKQISDKIQQQERSIDIENNNKDEKRYNIKEKKLERMIDDKTDNSYSNKEDMYTNDNTTLSSIVNSTIYDLQALLSQRQDRLSSVLYEHYQYNTSINREKEFRLNHVDSKLSLVVMYAHLVGSTKMSMALPVERMAKIVRAFLHDFVNYFQ